MLCNAIFHISLGDQSLDEIDRRYSLDVAVVRLHWELSLQSEVLARTDIPGGSLPQRSRLLRTQKVRTPLVGAEGY